MRNCRPLMVTVTCDMVRPFASPSGRPSGCPLASVHSTVIRFQNVAHRLDCTIETPRDFTVGGFERADARRRSVEVGRKLGAVAAQRMKLVGEVRLSAIH